ncbi:MAG: hypothetical protein ABUL62_34490 [Myxococcales bacterium]
MLTDTALFRDRNYHRPSDTPDQLDVEQGEPARLALDLSFMVVHGMNLVREHAA